MTTIDIIDDTVEAPARSAGLAADLRMLANMVDADPLVAEMVARQVTRSWEGDESTRLLIPANMVDADPLAAMRAFARVALKSEGVTVKKNYSDTYGAVDLLFPGDMCVHVYAPRAEVCERVVKGTREVVKEVPDPDALKAVPKVTVTETVEDVEWVCKPILDRE